MVKLMVFNPEQRITAVEALSHPFLAKLHMEEDEPAREPVSPMEFEFEKYNLNREQLKDCIYEEILLYHFPEKMKEYEERLKAKQSIYKHIINNDNKAFVDQESDDSEEEEDDNVGTQETMG